MHTQLSPEADPFSQSTWCSALQCGWDLRLGLGLGGSVSEGQCRAGGQQLPGGPAVHHTCSRPRHPPFMPVPHHAHAHTCTRAHRTDTPHLISRGSWDLLTEDT